MLIVRKLLEYLWITEPRLVWKRVFGSEKSVEKIVLCLSTGRVGSKTLAKLGELGAEVKSLHEPKPNLFGLSHAAYTGTMSPQVNADQFELQKLFVRACRDDLVKDEKVYLETSPQVTFAAPAFYKAYDNVYFIHLIRHPVEVVRSGMRRGWYTGIESDATRIRPSLPNSSFEDLTLLAKQIWLWRETNLWISSFLSSLPSERSLLLRSNDIFSGNEKAISDFFGFLGADVPSLRQIERVLNKHHNRQEYGEYPSCVNDWPESDQEFLRQMTGEICAKYGFKLD